MSEEMTHETAERDWQTELSLAHRKIDQLQLKLDESSYTNAQLEDIARMNTASRILPYFLSLIDISDEDKLADEITRAADIAISVADNFVAYYTELMEKNAAEYMNRVNAENKPTNGGNGSDSEEE